VNDFYEDLEVAEKAAADELAHAGEHYAARLGSSLASKAFEEAAKAGTVNVPFTMADWIHPSRLYPPVDPAKPCYCGDSNVACPETGSAYWHARRHTLEEPCTHCARCFEALQFEIDDDLESDFDAWCMNCGDCYQW
jgi:hypothetical protein